MNFSALKHLPKSNMAYALDENHLEFWLQTALNDFEKVELIIGDPFIYHITEKNGKSDWTWDGKVKPFIKMEKKYQTKYHDFYRIFVYTKTKRNKYAFLLYTNDEIYLYGSKNIIKIANRNELIDLSNNNQLFNLFNYFNYPYLNNEDLYHAPAWVKDTIWYQIFPDRFYPGSMARPGFLPFGSITKGITNHQFFGGSIKGITEKIPYLQSLGITGIYFTPLFKAMSAHKYDTTDYMQIDPQFGTNEDFYQLVQTAHQANIKVILDAVFNHSGWDFAFFQDVIKNKKASPYYDCFYIEDENFIDFELDENNRPKKGFSPKPLKYRTFATTPFMPKLNTSNPLMEAYLLEVTRYWMEEYHIDGWRLDVSNEVSHEFWRKFRKLVKSINPDAYILGENWDDSNAWLNGDQLDGVMNYELSYPIWQFFGTHPNDHHIDALEFKHIINNLLVRYPTHVAPNLFNIIDSHDTMRILNRCGKNKDLVKLALLFLFSFTGSPSLYYGTEIAMEGEHDPDNRRCMIWDENMQDIEMMNFIKRLISFRKNNPDFKQVDLNWLMAKNNILIYEKGKTIFIINRNPNQINITLPNSLKNKTFYSLFDNLVISFHTTLTLKPFQYLVLN